MAILSNIALFVEVGKVLNFCKAAETLDMPSSTVSRRISRLEKEIGLRLLHRTTRKVEFTQAGRFITNDVKKLLMRLI